MDGVEYKINPWLGVLRDDWKGNVCVGGRFVDASAGRMASAWDALRWRFGKNPQKKEKRNDHFLPQVEEVGDFSPGLDRIIWLGHSSFFISVGGVNMMTDPCFYNLSVIRRKVGLPCKVNTISPVDYLLISHDHRDHLDKRSIANLHKFNPTVKALVPLEVGGLLGGMDCQEAGWYQEFSLAKNIRIILLPARHWGRRGIFDTNRRLWGSFLIISERLKIYFAGDIGYDKAKFDEIHRLFGNIDICLLPIGAYSPRWMMSGQHMNPEEAFRCFKDLGGYVMIPMHYGTYDLSDEPMGEPLERLLESAHNAGCETCVQPLSVGEVLKL